jgi:hypothetical protein
MQAALAQATTYDVARQEFLALYPNRTQAILRPPGCKTWVSVSKHWPLPDEQIEKAIGLKEGTSVWGCRWGEHTRFAVLDIDSESKYHNVQELQKLTRALAAIGLTATLYQSSSSGGWHIYLFFDDWQPAHEIQATLKTWLIASQYEIRNGTLEIFPSGNGLRFPLQSGFAWLDSDAKVVTLRNELSTGQALSLFLDNVSARASDWSTTKHRIESQLEPATASAGDDSGKHQKAINTEGFEGLWNYRLIPEKYEDGRRYWLTGLTAKGQRHDAILAIEHYFWHGDPAADVPAMPGEWNDEARYRLILAWLKEKHNGFCNHINRGNWHKVESQIRRAVKWRRPSGKLQVVTPYPMTERLIERLIDLSRGTGRIWSIDDLRKGNDRRQERARAKISYALGVLLQQGSRITRNELARLSGCSPNTVRKHSDLWLLFAGGSGDLNSFVGLDPSQDPGSNSSKKELYLLPSVSEGDSGQTGQVLDRATTVMESVQLQDMDSGCLTPCDPQVVQEVPERSLRQIAAEDGRDGFENPRLGRPRLVESQSATALQVQPIRKLRAPP